MDSGFWILETGFWKLDCGLDCCNQSRLMHSLHFIYYFSSVGCWSSLHHRRKIHFSSPRHYYVNHRPISPAFHLIIAASGALAPLNRLFKVSPGQTQNLTAFFFYARWERNELQNTITIKSSPLFEHL